ncbi:MAG: hypothetical protein Q8P44_03710, partial [Dehalococcoidia bacterium]|nr:hypothetical protein [Dehalococcoidia bacterium]
AEIKETRERVGREIAQIVPIAQDTISQLGKDLRRGNEEALAEVHRLRDEAMEVGREVGRFKGMLEANEWLKELLDLVWGKENVEGKRVRTIALPVLRSIAAWLKRQGTPSLSSASLSLAIDRTISELEKWEV